MAVLVYSSLGLQTSQHLVSWQGSGPHAVLGVTGSSSSCGRNHTSSLVGRVSKLTARHGSVSTVEGESSVEKCGLLKLMGSDHLGDGSKHVQDRGSSVVGQAVAVDAEASGRVSGSGLPVVKASDLTVAAGALTPVLSPQPGECDGLSTTVYLKKILTSKVCCLHGPPEVLETRSKRALERLAF